MRYLIIGGRLAPSLELTLHGNLPVTPEKYADNIERAKALGLPEVEYGSGQKRKLAVVGGGSSIKEHVATLRNWDGDVLAINGAWGWCRDNGIDATFIAIDPHPIVLQWAAGVKRAILGDTCDPQVFDLLKDADVRLMRIADDGIKGTSSTATAIPHLAAYKAHSEVTFFGCESSYELTGTHAYQDEKRHDHMIVDCGGADWLTAGDLFRQAGELSEMIRGLSPWLKEESGGLLRAMVKDTNHRIVWFSDGFASTFKPHT